MIRALTAVVLLASSAAAAPALPSFENAAAQVRVSVSAARQAAVASAGVDIGARLDGLFWDLERAQQDASGLRADLRSLAARVGSKRDEALANDLREYNRTLTFRADDLRRRLDDLRWLSAQARKDPKLVAPASRVADAARRQQQETAWLLSDGRSASFALTRAGYAFESMDLDRGTGDLDRLAQDLQREAERLLAKVR